MDTLILFRRGQEVRRYPLSSELVEVGRAPGADLCIDDPALPPRAVLIQAAGGSVYVYSLNERPMRRRVLPYDGELPLGREHTLRRQRTPHPGHKRTKQQQTLSAGVLEPVTRWTMLLGDGPEARRWSVQEGPVRIGSGPDNDLVLLDRTVSACHCRLEPNGRELVVRDLDSRNGTFLNGLSGDRARIHGGARLRLGRSELSLVAAREDRGGERAFVAASSRMQQVLSEVQRFASLPWPTLILGPSGAGKEEVAAHMHRCTSRRRGPFVALNAGGLPTNLVESELFGHERGAFTGAGTQHRGVFEQAQGGTLFLDEIGELPLEMQARLLRVLETWSIRRVGAERDFRVDVRLLCATHRDLGDMVRKGRFREDLYYRLNRLVIRVPALKDRPDDILPLAEHFLATASEDVGHRQLAQAAKARLIAHDWPGNVRELRNVVCAAAAMSGAAALECRDIELAFERLGGEKRSASTADKPSLQRAVAEYGGNLSAAARALGLPRSTLRDRLRT